MKEQSIELDCPPGNPRPDDLIAGVIAGTGLKPREPVSKFFGLFVWDYQDVPEEEWSRIQKITEPRIRALYERGTIRYGSW